MDIVKLKFKKDSMNLKKVVIRIRKVMKQVDEEIIKTIKMNN